MSIKIYNKTNFHNHTFCNFMQVNLDEIKDLKINYKSKSGSCYYFVENGVYRLSNHWGRAAKCKWRLSLNSNNKILNSDRIKLGFANWTDFYSDNDFEKLYFIEVNFEKNTVNFFHKQSDNYTLDKILRTATETTKLIKQIRLLKNETTWANHLREENIEVLRFKIIHKLINSNQSFQEIKKSLY